jgi:nitrogen regulatory protein P-II 1
MKLIIAIIRPEKLAAVQAALIEGEACLLSVSEVLSGGPEPGRTGIYRGGEYRVRRPKLRLEIVVDDWVVEGVVEAIIRAGSTGDSGQIGDCKVLVMQLDGYVASVMSHEDSWPSPYEVEDPWRP